jgi:5-hydroxyisourate hydrolase
MTSLSTHILDLVHGCPAAGVRLRLLRDGAVLAEGVSDADGRCPALGATATGPGRYRLEFAVADYFRGRGLSLPEPPFLDVVGIDFAMAEAGGHYHVPLLVSPFGYSTYRGS